MLSPFKNVWCGNFILPETANYVSFCAYSFLRTLFYTTVASKKYLLSDCEMDTLFSIIDTAKYKAYNDSIVHRPIANNYNPDPLLGLYGRDYSEDYQDELRSIFCYSIYREGEQYVLRLKFDYIKHHTAVAFPTPIFVKRAPNEIVYEITSKNSSDVIQGKLNVLCESNSND